MLVDAVEDEGAVAEDAGAIDVPVAHGNCLWLFHEVVGEGSGVVEEGFAGATVDECVAAGLRGARRVVRSCDFVCWNMEYVERGRS